MKIKKKKIDFLDYMLNFENDHFKHFHLVKYDTISCGSFSEIFESIN